MASQHAEIRNSEPSMRELARLPIEFSYEDLVVITNNFRAEDKLGSGASGSVFKGTLKDGSLVAVKRVEVSLFAKTIFEAEVSTLASLRHKHLVRIRGYGRKIDGAFYVVYELLPEGSLDKWIFPKNGGPIVRFLSWEQRYQVAIGVARALVYLHQDCEPRILHLDVKPENILLDEKFRSVLADFGLSRLTREKENEVYTKMIRGTPGYMAPESFLGNLISEKFDIYSFGKVLLDLFFGKRYVCLDQNGINIYVEGGNSAAEQRIFCSFMRGKLTQENFVDLVDERLKEVGKVDVFEAQTLLDVALRCIEENPKKRPRNMRMVLRKLEAGKQDQDDDEDEPTFHTLSAIFHAGLVVESDITDSEMICLELSAGGEAKRTSYASDLNRPNWEWEITFLLDTSSSIRTLYARLLNAHDELLANAEISLVDVTKEKYVKKLYKFTGSKLQVHILTELQLRAISLPNPPDKEEPKQMTTMQRKFDMLYTGIHDEHDPMVHIQKSHKGESSSVGLLPIAYETYSADNSLNRRSESPYLLDLKQMTEDVQQTLHMPMDHAEVGIVADDLEQIHQAIIAIKLDDNEVSAEKVPEGSTSGEGVHADATKVNSSSASMPHKGTFYGRYKQLAINFFKGEVGLSRKNGKGDKPLKKGVIGSKDVHSKLIFFDGCNYSFDLEDLLRASAEVLGKGTYGTAYKAEMEDGISVAVKRLKEVGVGKWEFDQQMDIVGSIRHENVVELRACYYSKYEKLLVYDYYSQGSISAMLHEKRSEGKTPLDWDTRLKIAIGAARGIAYIHTENWGKFYHGNIKSSNVFLNSQNYGSISDLGLATLMSPLAPPIARATGYTAPEVTDSRNSAQPADVYSFGVLLLELITAKSPILHTIDGSEDFHLVRWVHSVIREEWSPEVFDVELMRYPNIEKEIVEMLQIAMSCITIVADQRPKMTDVVKTLEDIRPLDTGHRHSEEFKSESSTPTPPPPAESSSL